MFRLKSFRSARSWTTLRVVWLEHLKPGSTDFETQAHFVKAKPTWNSNSQFLSSMLLICAHRFQHQVTSKPKQLQCYNCKGEVSLGFEVGITSWLKFQRHHLANWSLPNSAWVSKWLWVRFWSQCGTPMPTSDTAKLGTCVFVFVQKWPFPTTVLPSWLVYALEFQLREIEVGI